MTRPLRTQHDDRGVVAIELAIVLPIIIGLLVTSITFAGLFKRSLEWLEPLVMELEPWRVSRPTADLNPDDDITVETRVGAMPCAHRPGLPVINSSDGHRSSVNDVRRDHSICGRVDGHRRLRGSDDAMRMTPAR